MGSLSSVIAPIASFGVNTALSAGKYIFSNTNLDNQGIDQNTRTQKQLNLLQKQQLQQKSAIGFLSGLV